MKPYPVPERPRPDPANHDATLLRLALRGRLQDRRAIYPDGWSLHFSAWHLADKGLIDIDLHTMRVTLTPTGRARLRAVLAWIRERPDRLWRMARHVAHDIDERRAPMLHEQGLKTAVHAAIERTETSDTNKQTMRDLLRLAPEGSVARALVHLAGHGKGAAAVHAPKGTTLGYVLARWRNPGVEPTDEQVDEATRHLDELYQSGYAYKTPGGVCYDLKLCAIFGLPEIAWEFWERLSRACASDTGADLEPPEAFLLRKFFNPSECNWNEWELATAMQKIAFGEAPLLRMLSHDIDDEDEITGWAVYIAPDIVEQSPGVTLDEATAAVKAAFETLWSKGILRPERGPDGKPDGRAGTTLNLALLVRALTPGARTVPDAAQRHALN